MITATTNDGVIVSLLFLRTRKKITAEKAVNESGSSARAGKIQMSCSTSTVQCADNTTGSVNVL